MKILVTGGAGFIASHITDAYIKAGHQVYILDNLSSGQKENLNPQAEFIQADITDKNLAKKLPQQIDVLNHHAALINVGKSVKDPAFDAQNNIIGTINLLQVLKDRGLKKVIFASTGGAMYGHKQTPFKEEMFPAPLSPYGISKRASELYLDFYYNQYEIPWIALRYANVYGPRQNPHGEAGVISIFCENILNNKQPLINGDGKQTRDYVFITDVVQSNLLATELNEMGFFNIGTKIETDVNEIYRQVNQFLGNKFPPKHGAERPGEQQTSSLDYSKAKQKLNWTPRVKLEDGLRLTVDWYKEKFSPKSQ
jgi:UDP-glucose 4-epimerase